PAGSPVPTARAAEQPRVDEVAAQHGDVVVRREKERVDLVLLVVARELEALRDEAEHRRAIGLAARDHFEPITAEETCQLGRTAELLAPPHVAGLPLHLAGSSKRPGPAAD